MRTLFQLLVCAVAVVGLHGGFFMLYDRRDAAAERAVPLQIARTPSVAGEATVLFAGDTAQADASLPVLRENGFEYPFAPTVGLIRQADLAVTNVEAPITDGGHEFPIYKDYIYRAPSRAADALAWAGFDVLQMANNHATDFGAEGIDDTIRNAERVGLALIGAGEDGAAARRGLIATIGEVRVGLLAYCENQILWRLYVDQFASPGHPGVAAARTADLARDIARLRPQVDVLIISFHMGENYAPPDPVTIRWSKAAVDLGADLVVNHHSHVAHPVMMYRGRPIVLSLGNYAFGTPGRPSLDYGLLAVARIRHRRIDRLEIIPLAVQNDRVHFQPQPLSDSELLEALGRLRRESAALGADLRIEANRAFLHLERTGS